MPTTTDIDYLDSRFTIQEPEPATLAELSELYGEDFVREYCVSNIRYRNKYPRVYEKVSKAVTELGFPKIVIGKKKNTKGEKDIHESDMDHLRAYLVGRPDDALTDEQLADREAKLQSLFLEIAPAEPLYVKGESLGGTGKVSTEAIETANKFLAKGDEFAESKATIIETKLAGSGYKIARDADGALTAEGLARGIMALQKFAIQDAKKKAAAELA